MLTAARKQLDVVGGVASDAIQVVSGWLRDTAAPATRRMTETAARRTPKPAAPVFRDVGRTLSRGLADVGRALGALTGRRAPASLEDLTKDELYERAQELEIDGRSQMTKDELVDALRSARS